MSSPIQLQTSAARQLQMALHGRVTGTGRLAPILAIPLAITESNPAAVDEMRLLSTTVEISCAGEIIADARLDGIVLTKFSRVVTPRLRTTPQLLNWVTDSMGARNPVTLVVHLAGAVQFRPDQHSPWTDDEIPPSGATSGIDISRSDWFEYVVSPVRQADFIYLEVAIPRAARAAWDNAIRLLTAAEDAYARGDDASVFQNVRGCIDALPGAKKDILKSVADPDKRGAVDELARKFGEYLHQGRHVAAASSPAAGTFPVDHVDAEFALAAAKLFLSYASKLLPRT